MHHTRSERRIHLLPTSLPRFSPVASYASRVLPLEDLLPLNVRPRLQDGLKLSQLAEENVVGRDARTDAVHVLEGSAKQKRNYVEETAL